MAWDPRQYLAFGGERLRPALDLIARVPLKSPRAIVDFGCGAGFVLGRPNCYRRWQPGRAIWGILDEKHRSNYWYNCRFNRYRRCANSVEQNV